MDQAIATVIFAVSHPNAFTVIKISAKSTSHYSFPICQETTGIYAERVKSKKKDRK